MKQFIFAILLCLIGCSGKKTSSNDLLIETIPIDKRNYTLSADISFMLDTSYFEIIPLETNDSCLIATVTRIDLVNDKIVVYDEMAHGAYIFNRDGSYHATVRAIGNGPGEYPPDINDIMVSKKYIGVLSPPFGIMLYDFDGKFVKKLSLEGTWGMNLISFDDVNFYLVNDWSSSDKGYFNLYRLDTENNKVYSYLPFSKKDYDVNRGWGLDKHYNFHNGKALIYFSTIDILYSLTPEGEITPQYKIDIVHKKLPDGLRIGDGYKAIESSNKNGYIKGVNDLTETSRYLFLEIDVDDVAIYDKKEKEVKAFAINFISSSFPYFDISFDFSMENPNHVISYVTGLYGYNTKEYIATKEPGNTRFEKEFRKALEKIEDEEANPVVIILKTKE